MPMQAQKGGTVVATSRG